jgi:hypothetical protein
VHALRDEDYASWRLLSYSSRSCTDSSKNESEERMTEVPIVWEPLNPSSFNPAFSGYTAAPYFTGNPELGWCLYSRDGRGTWNQRTKQILPPVGSKAHPVRIGEKWWWSYDFA